MALHWTACAAMQRVGSYWTMLPEAAQARKSMWDAINPHTGRRRIDDVFPHEIRENTRETDMFIRFKNGSTWQLVGSDNFDSLVGSPPVGLVFSEYPLSDPRAWPMLRPILLENGGWAIFPYTPRGKNHGWSLKLTAEAESNWLCDIRSVDDTTVFSSEMLEGERRELIRENGPEDGESIYRQEYFVSFEAAVRGAYYARMIEDLERAGRISGVPYDGAALVDTAWDIGIRDSTAIWFIQQVGRELHAIDYYEASGQPIAHYAEVLKSKPYKYGEHILPHDAEGRQLGTGKSTVEMLRGMQITARVAPRLSIDQGINAVRAMLPRFWFDAVKCERGVAALRQYRAKYDEEHKVLSSNPLHDWSSHGSDAFRMYAVKHRDKAAPEVPDRYRRCGSNSGARSHMAY